MNEFDFLTCRRCGEERGVVALGGGYKEHIYLVCDTDKELEFYGTGANIGYARGGEYAAAEESIKGYALTGRR
jgi:hypothetical protein